MTRRQAGQQGGLATVAKFGTFYMRAIGSAGGIQTAARRRRRLYESGVSLAAALGRR